MSRVTLENVRKVYAERGAQHVAVHGIDLTIADGEFLVLVGPSGCGKSTTLRMIAGLEEVTSGTITIGDRVVNDVPARDRDIAMVFQNYALYPHMTVYDNLAFALVLRKQARAAIDTQVRETAALLDIEALLQRKPRQLSGGQRQRVALGRAIVRQPQVFLFDEPLSNLDAKLRTQTRRELATLRRRLGTTAVYVTHDQVEAMTLGDRIVVMNEGRVQQSGTPLDVYARPANSFVAAFLGSPPMNLIRGRVEGATFASAEGSFRARLDAAAPAGTRQGDLVLGVRPEAVRLSTDDGAFDAVVIDVEPLGHEALLTIEASGVPVTMRVDAGSGVGVDQRVRARFDDDAVHWFDAASGARLG